MPDAPCPTPKHLRDYALGLSTVTDAAAIGAHVEVCPKCRRALDAVGEDDFVRRLRAGSRRSPPPKSPDPNGTSDGDVPAELLTGLAPKRFTSVVPVSRGGQGELFRAWDALMRRPVAIKWIRHADPGRAATGPTAGDRAEREIRITTLLRHPHIVEVYWADELPGAHRLVMEWLDGQDFHAWVEAAGPVRIADACAAVAQAALGLAFAHERGINHRDIKPRNLFRTATGAVKVIDFGVARPHAADDVRTDTGVAVGTPVYMSPEHFLNPQTVDARSDVYSLGCVLYFLLTGEPPFPAQATHYLTMASHVNADIPDVRARRGEVPPALAALVRQMLAKEPGARPQTAAEVAKKLAPFHAAPVVPAEPANHLQWRPLTDHRRRTISWPLIALMTGAAGVLLAASFLRQPGSPQTASAEPPAVAKGAKPGPAPGPGEKTSQPVPPVPPEFVSLFNGTDLKGWTTREGDTAVWVARDRRLVCEEGGSGNLMSVGEYRDFHFRARVRINSDGDSGVFVRARQDDGMIIGYQAEIRPKPAANGARLGDLIRYDKIPGLVFKLGDEHEPRDFRDWFRLEVIADGPRVTVLVNGTKTAEVTDAPLGTGRIYLNHATEATKVEFERVEIRVPAEPR